MIIITLKKSKKMKKAIMMMAMILPMILMAQNRAPENKVDRPVIENKPYKYEYVIIRGIIDSEVTKRQESVSPKKKAKKEETNYIQMNIQMNNVKGYMKHIQKSRWAINFDFGRTKSKEAQLVMKNEFHSMIDALNFLGNRGFDLVLSEVQKTPHGDMQIYYMRKPR